MVGIVKVDTLQNNAGTSSVGMDYVVNGSAKAWGTVNQVGTQAVLNSLNISSISDGGTGATTYTFSTSFDANDYSSTCSTQNKNNFAGVDSTRSSSAAKIFTYDYSGSTEDRVQYMTCVGDLA